MRIPHPARSHVGADVAPPVLRTLLLPLAPAVTRRPEVRS